VSRSHLTGFPQTRESIAEDLEAVGLRAGDMVLVHSSLRSLGWVCGGAVTVVQALLDVLGPQGTLVVPTHTANNSDPEHWMNPPVPEAWWPEIRATMPAFDPVITPTYGMGAIPELVRRWPGALRSDHPHLSFAAVGAGASAVTAGHRLDCQLGDHSPLGALERAGASVLLLGVGFGSCTAFHLAEYRIPDMPTFEFGAAVMTETGREWITYTDLDVHSVDFPELGAAYEASGAVTTGMVGEADCRLFDVRSAVEFAVGWLAVNRT
jgi:aminoglycoside 3-N-acetyltransferase